MIEVKLSLYGAEEVEIISRAYAEIARRREREIESEVFEVKDIMGEGQTIEPAPTDQISGFPPVASAGASAVPTPVLFTTSKEPLVRFEPSPELMETAVKAFAASKGMAAARALLDEFKVQRVGEVTGEQRAALYARLTA